MTAPPPQAPLSGGLRVRSTWDDVESPHRDTVWQHLRALRHAPPGGAHSGDRRKTFGSALEQAEQLLEAAATVGYAARPILLFYGLSQAGRAVAVGGLAEGRSSARCAACRGGSPTLTPRQTSSATWRPIRAWSVARTPPQTTPFLRRPREPRMFRASGHCRPARIRTHSLPAAHGPIGETTNGGSSRPLAAAPFLSILCSRGGRCCTRCRCLLATNRQAGKPTSTSTPSPTQFRSRPRSAVPWTPALSSSCTPSEPSAHDSSGRSSDHPAGSVRSPQEACPGARRTRSSASRDPQKS